MRSLLNLFVISALSLGCNSSLWKPFAEDTKWNCNVTPCTNGQTCNQATGICEGGGDMGEPGPDLSPPIFSREELLFKAVGRSFYHLAVCDLIDNPDPEIFLSGDFNTNSNNQDAVLLTFASNYGTAQSFGLTPGGQFITSVAEYRYTANNQPLDVVAVTYDVSSPTATTGNLLQFYRVGNTAAMHTTNLNAADGLVGYKTVAVGYVQSDLVPDVVITSSMSPIARSVYPSAPGDGKALIYGGEDFAVPRAGFKMPTQVANGNFQFITLLPRPSVSTWTNYNFIAVGTRVNNPNVDLIRDGGGGLFRAIPTSPNTDLAFIADMNSDTHNDLVLLTMQPATAGGALKISFNGGDNQNPTFGNQLVSVSDKEGVIAGATGVSPIDFNGDGFVDLVVSSYLTKSFLLLRNTADTQGRRFVPVGTVSGSVGARSVSHDDMNKDMCKDLVFLFGGDANGPGTEVKVLYGKC